LNLNDGGDLGFGARWRRELQETFLEALFHGLEGSSVPPVDDGNHGMGLHIQFVDEVAYGS
jgi:hypothetical protein